LHKVKEFMKGKAAMPGTTGQEQQAIAPTSSMQPATKQSKILLRKKDFPFNLILLGSNKNSK
jgi:hypothetical protein